MALQISPFGNNQFFTIDGKPAAGYQLFVYVSRSSTKQSIYADKDGIAKHTNPIILGVDGFPPSPLYIDTALSYKFVLAVEFDEDPPTSPVKTIDEVSVGLEATTITTPEWSIGTTPTYINATTFQIAGDQRSTYHAGRRLKLLSNAGILYGSVQSNSFSTNTNVVVLLDSGSLDNTLSSVYFGFLSASGSAWPGGYNNGLGTTFTGTVTITPTSSFNLLPVASIILTGASSLPPQGYLLCNGAAVSRTTYSALFGQIGVTFGAGDGSTTFNLPNISGPVSNVAYLIRYA